MAERTASTALPNSATTLSPAVLKFRPARQGTGVAARLSPYRSAPAR